MKQRSDLTHGSLSQSRSRRLTSQLIESHALRSRTETSVFTRITTTHEQPPDQSARRLSHGLHPNQTATPVVITHPSDPTMPMTKLSCQKTVD